MKRLLITICGRAGSKGFKNKNLKNFCGKPLVYYSLSAAELFIKKHPELEIDVALNTDSEDLARLVAAEYPEDFARVIGLHTYSQSPRRDYDIILTGEWVERGGFRFEEFVLTPRREDGNDGRTE